MATKVTAPKVAPTVATPKQPAKAAPKPAAPTVATTRPIAGATPAQEKKNTIAATAPAKPKPAAPAKSPTSPVNIIPAGVASPAELAKEKKLLQPTGAPKAGATSGKSGAVAPATSAQGQSAGSKTGTSAQVTQTAAPTETVTAPTPTEPANAVTLPTATVTQMQGTDTGASTVPSAPTDAGYAQGGAFLAGEQQQSSLDAATAAPAQAAATPTATGGISGFLSGTTGKIVVFGAVAAGGFFLYRRMNKGASMSTKAK